MANRPASVSDVFWIYNQPGAVVAPDSVWMRFDREFVRVMNADKMAGPDLAKCLHVSWRTLNSGSRRSSEPKWMTPSVLGAMLGCGFDVNYVLFGHITQSPL